MGKKILILVAVCLCVILFVMELSWLEKSMYQEGNLSHVKSVFHQEIQELKDGKYENLTASDFEASIDEVENLYRFQILHPEGYADVSFLEDCTFVIENALSQGENTLGHLWNPDYRMQMMQRKLDEMNEIIDRFFQTEVDKTYLEAHYWADEEYQRVKYNLFQDQISKGLTTKNNLFVLSGNETKEDGFMIQMSSIINDVWFSRGELGDIMPSFNWRAKRYLYLSGERQGEDVVLHLLDGDILLSEMEKRVLEYLNTDAFPLPGTEGIYYEIGEALVLENGKYEGYDGVCFIVRRAYGGVPFICGPWELVHLYDGYDTSEISYARSDTPDTMRDFGGLNGTVEVQEKIPNILSVGEALECLSDYFGYENGTYEVRGVELVYKSSPVPEEDVLKISDILEPKWRIIVYPGGINGEISYYVDVETGEIE